MAVEEFIAVEENKSEQMRKGLFIGIVSIIVSLLIGKLTTVFAIIYYNQPVVFWTSILFYLLSWLLLFIGIYLCGKEMDQARRFIKYFTIHYYHKKTKHSLARFRKKKKSG